MSELRPAELDPQPFRLLLDRILEPVKRHFRRIFLPVAVPLAACGVLAPVLQLRWLGALTGGGDLGEALVLVGGSLLLGILILAVYGLAFSALLVASLDALGGRPVEMRRAWLFALRPRVFGTLVVIAVISGLSSMMCLVPAFYVVPLLAYVLPAMVEEDLYGWAAIRRSAELAHYSPSSRWIDSAWLKTLVLLAVGAVINTAVTGAIALPSMVAQQIIALRDAVSGRAADPTAVFAATLWLQVPTNLMTSFASAATWLYTTFGIGLLYREIRRLREGEDLKRAIAALTGGESGVA